MGKANPIDVDRAFISSWVNELPSSMIALTPIQHAGLINRIANLRENMSLGRCSVD